MKWCAGVGLKLPGYSSCIQTAPLRMAPHTCAQDIQVPVTQRAAFKRIAWHHACCIACSAWRPSMQHPQRKQAHLGELIEWLWVSPEVVQLKHRFWPRQLILCKVGVQASVRGAEVWDASRHADARATQAHHALDASTLDILGNTCTAAVRHDAEAQWPTMTALQAFARACRHTK